MLTTPPRQNPVLSNAHKARCFLGRQNSPEVNYSPTRISGGVFLEEVSGSRHIFKLHSIIRFGFSFDSTTLMHLVTINAIRRHSSVQRIGTEHHRSSANCCLLYFHIRGIFFFDSKDICHSEVINGGLSIPCLCKSLL